MTKGLLKPDTFHDERLIGQTPGVNVLLVLYNRFHNYVAEKLLEINEGGRFTCRGEDEASLAKLDEDLFQTARLYAVSSLKSCQMDKIYELTTFLESSEDCISTLVSMTTSALSLIHIILTVHGL